MKNCLSGLLFLLLSAYASGQTFSPIAVTGFNHDVIAEGTGSSSLTTTTKEMDAISISNNVICTKQFAAANGGPTWFGIPNDGLIANGTRTWQLAGYTGNNTLSLLTQESGTLALTTPDIYGRITLLATSTEGNSTLTVTFNFDDGTTTQFTSQVFSDWFNITTNVAIAGYGRVKRQNGPFAAGDWDGSSTNPRMYFKDYLLPCFKKLVSISFKNNSSTIAGSGSFRTYIFAVGGLKSPVPTKPVAADVSLCAVGPATLTVSNTSSDFTYGWSTLAGATLATSATGTFTTGTVTSDSTFYVGGINNIGCVGERTPVKVIILPKVPSPKTDTAKLCGASTATITVTDPNSALTYNWFSSAAGGTVIGTGTSFTSGTVSSDSAFYVVAVSSANCASEVTQAKVIFVNPPSPPVVDDINVCPGSSATLTVDNAQSGIVYEWFDAATGGTSLGTGTSYTFPYSSGATTYYVSASTNSSCVSTRTAVTATALTAIAKPVVTATSIGIDEVTFTWGLVSGAIGYEVSVDGGAYQTPSSGSGANATTHTVKVTGSQQATVSISVIALGQQECQNSAPGLASAKLLAKEVYVPNAFTPNGDGKNDEFKVYGNGIATIQLKIFNQWGELVFTTSDVNKAWDGTFNGKQQPVGVYIYAVKLVLTTGEEVVRKGDINLVR
ncbi:gliding motility-associated C-terminal domain-containing protein [Filimonas lacunae]|uniref:Gliding motility-associated C-terminal domain-containing protein n=1 Tax=Filimonas lacunae TaxID=477680 RepID=A0A173MLJ7_9BACT|nr:gliding motility-associated C-terminal domain-containing protein [Filimonas lacunae]BAV08350.1 CHU large protein [Filimonas lacunae]SIT33440.1 gliding motility-associated C-terminal domain-containing protein [Filimonas lacunae]